MREREGDVSVGCARRSCNRDTPQRLRRLSPLDRGDFQEEDSVGPVQGDIIGESGSPVGRVYLSFKTRSSVTGPVFPWTLGLTPKRQAMASTGPKTVLLTTINNKEGGSQ